MTTGQSGGENARLEQLRRQYPRWRIWRGRVIGEYWAMRPPGHPIQRGLISARELENLALRLTEVQPWHDLYVPCPQRPLRGGQACRGTRRSRTTGRGGGPTAAGSRPART